MIVGLEGKIATLGGDSVVLNVGGVFYRVYVPGPVVGALGRPGETVHLFTHHYIREDQQSLYGSPDERQLKMFETLLTVSGIGPRVALSILGAMPVDALESAIGSGNVDLLTRVPGIGRKTASRLVLELKGKLELQATAAMVGSPTAAAEVIEALSSLGYTPAEIQAALSGISAEDELTTEDLVLYALKRLGR